MIAHYWHTLEGQRWFSAAAIYAAQVRRATDGAIFVELGSWKGRSTAFMGAEIANSGKWITFHCVDHWLGSAEEESHGADDDVRSGRLYDTFLKNVEPVAGYVNPIRSDSAAAAARFPDGSVDFVYVDAGHTYDDVLKDIAAWWPKLKVGGVIAGDDWRFQDERTCQYTVMRAVYDYFVPRGIQIVVRPGEPDPTGEQWLVEKPALQSDRVGTARRRTMPRARHAEERLAAARLQWRSRGKATGAVREVIRAAMWSPPAVMRDVSLILARRLRREGPGAAPGAPAGGQGR